MTDIETTMGKRDAMEKGDVKHGEITHQTRMPLGMVAGLLAGVGIYLGMWWDLKVQIAALRNDISPLQRQTAELWTRQQQEIFSLRIKLGNPNLNVPEMRDIK